MRFLTVFFVFLLLNTVQAAVNPDRLISSSARVFVYSAPIKNFLGSCNYLIDKVLDENVRGSVRAYEQVFSERTGVDFFDEYSLKKFGVDTTRSLCLAVFPKYRNNQMLLISVPVTNDSSFPLKFIEMIRKNRSENANVYPVITPYKGHSIYQIGRDIFLSSVSGNFLIASDGDIIRDSIDNLENPSSTLLYDNHYLAFRNKQRMVQDINFYIHGQGQMGPEEIKSAVNFFIGAKSDTETGGNAEVIKSPFMFLYGGLSLGKKSVYLSAETMCDSKSEDYKWLTEIFRNRKLPDLGAESDMSFFSISLDMKSFEGICRSGRPGCEGFTAFKTKFEKVTGMSFDKDLVSASNGILDIYAGMDDKKRLLYSMRIPVKDGKHSVELWKKMKKNFYRLNKKSGAYKEEKSGTLTFFKVGDTGKYTHVGYSGNCLFMGNDLNAIKKAIAGAGKKNSASGQDSFMVSRIKGNLLKLLFPGSETDRSFPDAFFERIGELNFSSHVEGKTIILKGTADFR